MTARLKYALLTAMVLAPVKARADENRPYLAPHVFGGVYADRSETILGAGFEAKYETERISVRGAASLGYAKHVALDEAKGALSIKKFIGSFGVTAHGGRDLLYRIDWSVGGSVDFQLSEKNALSIVGETRSFENEEIRFAGIRASSENERISLSATAGALIGTWATNPEFSVTVAVPLMHHVEVFGAATAAEIKIENRNASYVNFIGGIAIPIIE